MEFLRGKKVCFVTEDVFSGKYLAEMYDLLLPLASEVKLMSLLPQGMVSETEAIDGILAVLRRGNFTDQDFIVALGDDYPLRVAKQAAERYQGGVGYYEIRKEL